MRLQRIDPENARGFIDKFFGLGKELVGSVIDNEGLRKEGEAQQAKGSERIRALQDQVKAKGKEAKAEVLERQQRAAQKMKESA